MSSGFVFLVIGLSIAIAAEGETYEGTREFCFPGFIFLSSGGVGGFVAGVPCGVGGYPHSAGAGCCFPRDSPHAGRRCLGRRGEMKYLFAWLLGVPGILIILWFLLSH
jgi:hypothetical protein